MMNLIEKINMVLGEDVSTLMGAQTGATLTANVEKNPVRATNMVRRTPPELLHPQCGEGQRWDPKMKTCVPDPRVSEGIESDIELVRSVAKDQGVDEFISDAEAKKIIRDVKKRGSKEDFYYNLKEYFYA